jgi:predicted small secreted protein
MLSAQSYPQRKTNTARCSKPTALLAQRMQPIDSLSLETGMESACRIGHSYAQSISKGNPMKALMIVLLGLFAVSLTGCNTVAGAGKDVQATGQAVENAADQAKPK